MSFPVFDSFQHDVAIFVEPVSDELRKAGFTPNPKNIKNYHDKGGIAVHLVTLQNDAQTQARFTRRNEDWVLTFDRKDTNFISMVDETPPLKELVARDDVQHWSMQSNGWSRGYVLTSQEALNAAATIVRTQDLYVMDHDKSTDETPAAWGK